MDLTIDQLLIIQTVRQLCEDTKWVTVNEVAAHLKKDRSNISRNILSLQESGWLQISPPEQVKKYAGGRPARLWKLSQNGEKLFKVLQKELSRYRITIW